MRTNTRAIPVGSRYYQPRRGGHAPGDLRDAFDAAVEAFEVWSKGTPEPTVELCDRPVSIRKVFGLCWNCTDTLPNLLEQQIADLMPLGHERRFGSYAQAARALRALIVEG